MPCRPSVNKWRCPAAGRIRHCAGFNRNLAGRKYEEAVKTLQPYDKLKEANPDERVAGRALITEGKAAGTSRKTFIYINNCLEGNALQSIRAMVADA